MGDACETCRTLLSEGLDLCVRARQMDAMDRREAALQASGNPQGWVESGRFDQYVAEHNTKHPDTPISTNSGTMPLWLQDQYERDLADWERRGRQHLMQGCRALSNREDG